MKLDDLLVVDRVIPWSNVSKIPWDDPSFSARMLREHLSQEHDRASRRFATIDAHVSWIHETFCGAKAGSRILDLGCGPGFYTARLARLGHACVGIDFSPASIAHARAEAERSGVRCEYRQEDLRAADLPSDLDVVVLASGELNTFPPSEARSLLARAGGALRPGGCLILEVHSEAFVRAIGAGGRSWHTARASVFSDDPHLCLKECAWHPEQSVATERYFVVSLASGEVATCVSTTQAWSDEQYLALLREAHFDRVERYPSLSGKRVEKDDGLFVLVARSNQETQA